MQQRLATDINMVCNTLAHQRLMQQRLATYKNIVHKILAHHRFMQQRLETEEPAKKNSMAMRKTPTAVLPSVQRCGSAPKTSAGTQLILALLILAKVEPAKKNNLTPQMASSSTPLR